MEVVSRRLARVMSVSSDPRLDGAPLLVCPRDGRFYWPHGQPSHQQFSGTSQVECRGQCVERVVPYINRSPLELPALFLSRWAEGEETVLIADWNLVADRFLFHDAPATSRWRSPTAAITATLHHSRLLVTARD